MGLLSFYDDTTAPGPVQVHLPDNWAADGTGKLVLLFPGHLAPALDYTGSQKASRHARRLARNQHAIVAYKPRQWYQDGFAAEVAGVVDWARTHSRIRARPASAGKYAVAGWSMGGYGAACLAAERPGDVACVWTWVGALDGRLFSGRTGYVPSYSIAPYSSNPMTWQTEISGLWGIAPGGPVPAGKDPLAMAAAGAYAGMPMHLIQTDDDATVPPASCDAFAAAAASPLITVTHLPAGGHLDPFTGTPLEDYPAFFGAHLV